MLDRLSTSLAAGDGGSSKIYYFEEMTYGAEQEF